MSKSFILFRRNFLQFWPSMKFNGKPTLPITSRALIVHYVTPILRNRLYWLRAPQRIEFKVALLMYKGINNLAPDYITSYCISSSTNQRRSALRSADKGNLIEPKSVTEFGKRSFAFAGPHLWNKLPINIQQSSSVDIFKKMLKTFLFDKSYND